MRIKDGSCAPVLCHWRSLLITCLWPFFLPGVGWGAPLAEETGTQIRSFFSGRPPTRLQVGRDWPVDGQALALFYRQRGYRPAWLDNTGLSPLAEEMLDELRSVGRFGLCVEDYPVEPLVQLLRQAFDATRIGFLHDARDLARLDLFLSEAFFRLSGDLIDGRVRGAPFHGSTPPLKLPEPAARYGALLLHPHMAAYLATLLPLDPAYARLQERFEAYQLISARGGWPQLPVGELPDIGVMDVRLPALRKRLELSGDLAANEVLPEAPYEQATEAALLRFQRRHGLPGDGRLTPATVAELNTPVEMRIRKLELNLERARWLPRSMAEREVKVNIAAFSLTASSNGQVELTMPVVVGSAYRQTPGHSSRIGRIEFAPYWTVPRTILSEDKLPRIRRDPTFLQRNHYRIIQIRKGEIEEVDPATVNWKQVTAETFPGLLRMDPGPWNPLGRVKFLFPNPYDVYLHDTSDPQLFGREDRSLSSGCIRVARPVDLTLFLLRGVSGWNEARVREAMARKEPQPLSLERSVPVHIIYGTAWVDDAGELQMRNDFYQRDFELEQALLNVTAQRRPAPDQPSWAER